MNPFDPGQSLEQIQAILLPIVTAEAAKFSLLADIKVDNPFDTLMLKVWRNKQAPMTAWVPRVSLQSSAYMDQQFMIQVDALAQRAAAYPLPPPDKPVTTVMPS
jgi:hypothetical protein